MKLLIVDDSNVIRKAVRKYSSKHGLEVVGAAGDGSQALEMFREHRPDIVTLDITMPEVDGMTCLDEMLQEAPDTRIIIITALSDKSTALQALEKGAVDYIPKPIQEERLDRALQKAMEPGGDD
jgi:two-component system chemotaxis response regulator CheY